MLKGIKGRSISKSPARQHVHTWTWSTDSCSNMNTFGWRLRLLQISNLKFPDFSLEKTKVVPQPPNVFVLQTALKFAWDKYVCVCNLYSQDASTTPTGSQSFRELHDDATPSKGIRDITPCPCERTHRSFLFLVVSFLFVISNWLLLVRYNVLQKPNIQRAGWNDKIWL